MPPILFVFVSVTKGVLFELFIISHIDWSLFLRSMFGLAFSLIGRGRGLLLNSLGICN